MFCLQHDQPWPSCCCHPVNAVLTMPFYYGRTAVAVPAAAVLMRPLCRKCPATAVPPLMSFCHGPLSRLSCHGNPANLLRFPRLSCRGCSVVAILLWSSHRRRSTALVLPRQSHHCRLVAAANLQPSCCGHPTPAPNAAICTAAPVVDILTRPSCFGRPAVAVSPQKADHGSLAMAITPLPSCHGHLAVAVPLLPLPPAAVIQFQPAPLPALCSLLYSVPQPPLPPSEARPSRDGYCNHLSAAAAI